MTKKEKVKHVVSILHEKFGNPKCALDYDNVYQLMVAVILSAQCTDVRVNIVSKDLFKVIKKPEDVNNMDIETLEKYIKSTGFYRNKSKNIKLNAQVLIEKFNSEVPDNMADLITLAGVGRKTANVILGEHFHKTEGIVVDTHVKRLSNKIGFVESDNPEIIEKELMKIVPKTEWFNYSNYLILHGRDKCKARSPKCDICEINTYCNFYTKLRKVKNEAQK